MKTRALSEENRKRRKKIKKRLTNRHLTAIIIFVPAGVAHPVERHLAKVEVASSSLVTRSIKQMQVLHLLFFLS